MCASSVSGTLPSVPLLPILFRLFFVAHYLQELMCAGSVSGTLLSALAGGEGTTAAQASQALFNQLAKDLLAGGCSCCDLTQFDSSYKLVGS